MDTLEARQRGGDQEAGTEDWLWVESAEYEDR